MQDPVAISLQGELYALERRTLTEYNSDNTLFTSRADVLRLDEDLQSRQPVTTYDIATDEIAKFDNIPTTTYLAPISSSGDLMLLVFTRKPTRFRLVMRTAPVETTHHFGIAMPSKEYIATLRPCFDGGAATQPTGTRMKMVTIERRSHFERFFHQLRIVRQARWQKAIIAVKIRATTPSSA